MNYNDSQIMSDDTYIKCQSAYEKLSANTVHDLGEILEKLESQKKAIISANLSSNNSQILDGINESITGLKSILHANIYTTQKSNTINSKNVQKFSQKLSTQNVDIPPYTYSENRSDSISEYMGGNIPNLFSPSTPNNTPNNPQNMVPNSTPNNGLENPSNISPTTPSQELSPTPVPSDNISPNNRAENRARVFSRSCPQQSSFIARLLSGFKVNSNSKEPRTKATAKVSTTGHTAHSIHSGILYKNKESVSAYNYPRFTPYNKHNAHPSHSSREHSRHPEPGPHCTPERDIISRQIDIVRLLILYLQLRPSYPYCYRICGIASTQFDILSTLINI